MAPSNPCPFKPKATVAAYIRDSGYEEQEMSAGEQEAAIRKYCAENSLALTNIYTDAISGKSTTGRDAFHDMIKHFRAGETTEAGILIWKFNRFARNIDDAQFYKADLRRRGFIIHSLNDSVPDTLDGRFFESAIDWMNARYLEDLRVDIKRGMAHITKTYGTLGGTPPRGFMRQELQIGTHRDGKPRIGNRWVPDPEWIDRIKLAFSMRAQGQSLDEINQATHLYKGNTSYYNFFSNQIYIGILDFAGQTIENYCEPVIDKATWETVQTVQAQAKRWMHGKNNDLHPRRITSNFALSGLAHCARCGALLSGTVVQFKSTADYRYEYYACSNQNRHAGCDAKMIPRKLLEDTILETITQYVLNPVVLAQMASTDAATEENRQKDLVIQKNYLRDQMAAAARQIENITTAISASGKSAASLIDKIQDLERERYQAKEKLYKLEHPEPSSSDILAAKRRDLATADMATLHAILSGIIEDVLVELDEENHKLLGLFKYFLPGDLNTSPGHGTGGGGSGGGSNLFDQSNSHLGHVYTHKFEVSFSVPVKRGDGRVHKKP